MAKGPSGWRRGLPGTDRGSWHARLVFRPLLCPAGRWFVVLGLAAVCAGCGLGGPDLGAAADPAPTSSPVSSLDYVTGAAEPPQAPSPSSTPSSTPAGSAPIGLAAADLVAGLTSATFPQRGRGRLVTVPGELPAPGRGRVVKVRVEVEAGLSIDPAAFAGFVLDTLNDRRGWGHDGSVRFARTDGAATVRVVLASPDTSARLCRPLQTFGRLSCRSGDAAILTVYRWVRAIPEYGADRTGYRHYVVSHEVGHFLGHGHGSCPGRGRPAPVMMQQTKGLQGCEPNSWPFPLAGS